MNSNPEPIAGRKYIERLASEGRYHFTSRDAQNAMGVSPNAAKLALNRLRHQGAIAMPARGFYVIVPPEYRSLECLPAEQFIPALLAWKHSRYYAGLLSAAQYYGAAHQRPQEFQVFMARNRRPIRCGRVRIAFFARKRIEEVPVRSFNTARGEINVSTPEATAIDLAGYPMHAGGLDQVTGVLHELAEQIDPILLARAAATAPLPWAQRLGYLLEVAGAVETTRPLDQYVQSHARAYVPLAPNGPSVRAEKRRDWKLIVNVTVEPDL